MSDYVVVTTVSTFRHRYVMHKDDLRKLNTDVIPTNADLVEWAQDAVTCEDVEDFSQMHIGESIVDTVEMTKEEMLKLFDIDNDYLKNWSDEYKIQWVRRTLNKEEPFESYHDFMARMNKENGE